MTDSTPVLVVTKFRFRRYTDEFRIRSWHFQIVRDVKALHLGFLAAGVLGRPVKGPDGLSRQLTTVSVWRTLEAAVRIGESAAHVRAAHLAAERRISIDASVYAFDESARDAVARFLTAPPTGGNRCL